MNDKWTGYYSWESGEPCTTRVGEDHVNRSLSSRPTSSFTSLLFADPFVTKRSSQNCRLKYLGKYPGNKDKMAYSRDNQFLHQSTGHLPVPGCINTHGLHVKKANHIDDLSSLRIEASFSCEVIHSSMPMHLVQEINVVTVRIWRRIVV